VDNMDEPRYQLSVREIEDAKASKFWRAIEERLEEFLVDIHLQFENPENELGDYKHLSGNALTVRRVLAIPEVLIAEAESRAEFIQMTQEEGKDGD
jgi:hypothetical protein